MSQIDRARTEEREVPSVRITVIIQNRYTLDTEVVTDVGEVRVGNGDHFFAQPASQREVGHRGAPE
jgi:hypothetical protein